MFSETVRFIHRKIGRLQKFPVRALMVRIAKPNAGQPKPRAEEMQFERTKRRFPQLALRASKQRRRGPSAGGQAGRHDAEEIRPVPGRPGREARRSGQLARAWETEPGGTKQRKRPHTSNPEREGTRQRRRPHASQPEPSDTRQRRCPHASKPEAQAEGMRVVARTRPAASPAGEVGCCASRSETPGRPEARAEGMRFESPKRRFPQLALRALKQGVFRWRSFDGPRREAECCEARGASRGNAVRGCKTPFPSACASGFEAGGFYRTTRRRYQSFAGGFLSRGEDR